MQASNYLLICTKRALCALLAVALTISMTPIFSFAENASSEQGSELAASSLPNVAYRTQDQIKAFARSHPFNLDADTAYDVYPSLSSPIYPGRLASKTQYESLNALNTMRYIAGLNSNVTLDTSHIEKAQAASLILALNKKLVHDSAQPAGVSKELYDIAYQGCKKGNLSAGTNRINPGWSILGYMNDSGASTIAKLGHRRWLLNPKMGKTGFGQVREKETILRNWSVTYAHDTSNKSATETNVVWPAQNMPIDYFGASQAWSVSTGAVLENNNIRVTLTRRSDGKRWVFTKTYSNGFFSVSNGAYGQRGCVIFRPSGLKEIKVGDVFRVQVEGIPSPLDYNVTFFTINHNYKTQKVKLPYISKVYSILNLDKSHKLIKAKKFKMKAKGAVNSVTFKRITPSSYITVAPDGSVVIKKGTPKGDYKIKVKVTAKAAYGFKKGSTTTSIRIKLGEQKIRLKRSIVSVDSSDITKEAVKKKVKVITTSGLIMYARNISDDPMSKKIKIARNRKSELIVKVPKKFPKGTYKLTIKIKAPKSAHCVFAMKDVELKVKVK